MRPQRTLRSALLRLGLLASVGLAGTDAAALDPDRLPSQYGIRFWDTGAGLPSGAVSAVMQDSEQYLWLATSAGPVRFNGNTFTVFRAGSVPGVPEGAITTFATAADGALWMGTVSGAVASTRNGRFETQTSGLGGATITSLAADPKGGVYVAALSGLQRLQNGAYVAVLAVQYDYQSLLQSREGVLWVGTRGRGLVRAEARAKGMEVTAQYQVADGLAGNIVTALHQAPSGDLWIGTTSGLSRLHDGKLTSLTTKDGLAHNQVTAIVSDADGNLWVGTRAGLSRIREGRIDTLGQRDGMTQSDVRSLFIDHEGNLWAGTAGGLARISDSAFITYGAAEGISSPRVRSVTTGRGGAIWVGTDAGGVFRIQQGRTAPLVASPPLPAESILVVREAPDGAVWVGTDEGHLFSVRNGALTEETPGQPEGPGAEELIKKRGKLGKVSLALPGDGEIIWALQNGGLGWIRQRRFEPLPNLPEQTESIYVLASYIDASGTYWMGTPRGLLRVRGRNTKLLKPEDGLPNVRVRWIHGDSDGTLWLATQGGLGCMRNDKFLRTLTHRDGLPEDFLRSILDDGNGNFWMSSVGHIFRIPRQELVEFAEGKREKVTAVEYDLSDGIRSLECPLGHSSAARSPDGRLWFATADGVSMVDPARHSRMLPSPKVVIESLSVDGTIGLQPAYPPGRGSVEVRFAALSYRAPEKTVFRYKLDGVDEGWVEATGDNSARYTRLGPGQYTFEVSAHSKSGAFAEQATAVTFVLGRHWYQTWWWYGVVTASIFALAGVIYDWRVRALHERRRVLETQVERRTADLQKEIVEHQRTEQRLKDQMAERDRAEAEARELTQRLAQSNIELTENRDALVRNQDALERENLERRRAEEQAVMERDLLHALMDNIPDLIYFKDRESRFTRINRAHAELLGVADVAQAYGKTEADLLPLEFAHASFQDERELFASGQPLLAKVEHDPRSDRWLLSTKVPIRTARNQITGLVGISKDITERKRAEERLAAELADFQKMVNEAARGDLTHRGKEGEETVGQIARAVNGMLDGFEGILLDVRETALQVSASSSQILASSTRIARGAQLGRDQVHDTVSSVEEMARSMAQVSKSAEASADKARQVLEHVQSGDRAMEASHEGMTKINAAAMETAQKMHSLKQRSSEVFQIIELIDEISSQSKLLSLNAAIEAAHAGDLGRGFAVVASEVRRLAEMSADATKQASARIDAIVEETQKALDAMEHAMREVKAGWALSEQARKSLGDISALVRDSADVSLEIAHSSREQTSVTEQVAKAMELIDNFTKDSAASADETSNAVRALVDLAAMLNDSMSRFKIGR